MKIGLNLSFAVKRWLEPEYLAAMVRNDLQTEYVQFTWDLVDPWWPATERDAIAREWDRAFAKEGVVVTGTFGGLASYTYPQLLAPTAEQRRISLEFFKRAIEMTAAMGGLYVGTPLGGMTHRDAYNPQKRSEIYAATLESMHELATYAKLAGLEKIIIEPTPLYTEFPSTPAECVKLMKDLEGSAVPVRLVIDWGHALFRPLLKELADMEVWLAACSAYIDCFHLQQTDGLLDRHWGFTNKGLLDTQTVRSLSNKYALNDKIQYVEIIYPFEATDEDVYADIRQTMMILHES